MDGAHDVNLDDILIFLDEGCNKASGLGALSLGICLMAFHTSYSGERIIKVMEVYLLKFEVLPVKILSSSDPSTNGVGAVVMNDFLLLLMVCNATIVVLEAMNMIFLLAFTLR